MANGKIKGGKFERSICVQLSEWWTNGERSDIFWRTSASGGRATIRTKSGRKTHGQYGDVCATDPIGQPLIDFVNVELKKGYSRDTIADVIDKSPRAKIQTYEKWMRKSEDDAIASGKEGWAWWVIHQRHRRELMIYLPETQYKKLFPKPPEIGSLFSPYILADIGVYPPYENYIVGVKLEQWLVFVKPKMIREMVE
jgi:hypothetical protein